MKFLILFFLTLLSTTCLAWPGPTANEMYNQSPRPEPQPEATKNTAPFPTWASTYNGNREEIKKDPFPFHTNLSVWCHEDIVCCRALPTVAVPNSACSVCCPLGRAAHCATKNNGFEKDSWQCACK